MSAPSVFAKGEGTGNDFVVLPDPDASLTLDAVTVKELCDRRFGIGGDGILRVVPTAAVVEVAHHAEVAPWFMDYRNADGSLAEMCGNGIRVFARYLVEEGFAPAGRMAVATRGGVRELQVPTHGDIDVAMGTARPPLVRAAVLVSIGDTTWPATGVFVPNPHAVVFVDDLAQAGELRAPPEVLPQAAFPEGVNVEFVVDRGPAHVALRVHERGSGETLSCGTGAVAVAWAARRRDDADPAPEYRVDVPGGTLWVREGAAGELVLRGPARIVARGTLTPR